MKKKVITLIIILTATLSIFSVATAQENPYGNLGYSDCTWTAWKLAYERLGIALPRWGYADDWFDYAARDGYPVGYEPEANSIIVWLGHVGFVDRVENGKIHVMQGGGYEGNGYWEEWYGPHDTSSSGKAFIGYIYLGNIPSNRGEPYNSTFSPSSENLTEAQKKAIKKTEIETEIKTKQEENKNAEREIKDKKDKIENRLRAIYMMGDDSYLEFLFTSQDMKQFLERAEFISKILQSDNKELNEIEDLVTKVEENNLRIETLTEELKIY